MAQFNGHKNPKRTSSASLPALRSNFNVTKNNEIHWRGTNKGEYLLVVPLINATIIIWLLE